MFDLIVVRLKTQSSSTRLKHQIEIKLLLRQGMKQNTLYNVALFILSILHQCFLLYKLINFILFSNSATIQISEVFLFVTSVPKQSHHNISWDETCLIKATLPKKRCTCVPMNM